MHTLNAHIQTQNEQNALHALCRGGKLQGMHLMKRILEQNPHCLNTKNQNGRTPIMECAYEAFQKSEKEKQEREEIILFLLEQGAEIHHKDEFGHNLLFWCRFEGLNNVENVLLKV